METPKSYYIYYERKLIHWLFIQHDRLLDKLESWEKKSFKRHTLMHNKTTGKHFCPYCGKNKCKNNEWADECSCEHDKYLEDEMLSYCKYCNNYNQ